MYHRFNVLYLKSILYNTTGIYYLYLLYSDVVCIVLYYHLYCNTFTVPWELVKHVLDHCERVEGCHTCGWDCSHTLVCFSRQVSVLRAWLTWRIQSLSPRPTFLLKCSQDINPLCLEHQGWRLRSQDSKSRLQWLMERNVHFTFPIAHKQRYILNLRGNLRFRNECQGLNL